MAAANEFSIIDRYFQQKSLQTEHNDVLLSIGDDCAVVQPKPGYKLVFSIDTLIAGVHFPHHSAPEQIATKALAANLSDLAAMGAEPAWFTLAISLTENDPDWLERFSTTLLEMANDYDIQLVGGDTTRSSVLTITIQVHGYVKGEPLLRSSAKEGDLVAVTGKLGAAALGLQIALNPEHYHQLSEQARRQALAALHHPIPQLKAATSLNQYCNCAIDISDGLCADIGHILEQSNCAARIDVEQIPLADCLREIPYHQGLKMALTGGDDYQLCFTLSKAARDQLKDKYPDLDFTVIGGICSGQGLQLMINNKPYQLMDDDKKGYNHFG